MFAEQFANVRAKSPLVHNITNYVTVNDCANMVLACGASPIMADDAAEVEDITHHLRRAEHQHWHPEQPHH